MAKSLHESQLHEMAENLSTLRAQHCFTDAVIVCGGHEFQVHRVVISGGSAYFAAMFRADMVEATTGRVELHGVDSDAMSIVLDYLYGKNIEFLEENDDKLMSVLCASHLLQVEQLYKRCWEKLVKTINPTNFLDAWNLGDRFQNVNFCKWVVSNLVKNYQMTVNSDDFLRVNSAQLQQLINDPAIHMVTTENLLKSVLKWGSHNQQERSVEVSNILLSKFANDFAKLSNSVLAAMMTDQFVQSLPDVLVKILEVSAERLSSSAVRYGGSNRGMGSNSSLNNVGVKPKPKPR